MEMALGFRFGDFIRVSTGDLEDALIDSLGSLDVTSFCGFCSDGKFVVFKVLGTLGLVNAVGVDSDVSFVTLSLDLLDSLEIVDSLEFEGVLISNAAEIGVG